MRRSSWELRMARMFPERLTADAPSSERRVHEALRTGLDGSFVVFHSVSWHGRNRKPDGEVDFLVAHADLGLLVLEVKGGQIGIDPRRGTWLSKDGQGETVPLRRGRQLNVLPRPGRQLFWCSCRGSIRLHGDTPDVHAAASIGGEVYEPSAGRPDGVRIDV